MSDTPKDLIEFFDKYEVTHAEYWNFFRKIKEASETYESQLNDYLSWKKEIGEPADEDDFEYSPGSSDAEHAIHAFWLLRSVQDD